MARVDGVRQMIIIIIIATQGRVVYGERRHAEPPGGNDHPPDDDTQQKGNETTEKATKTVMRAFEQWRSDTKQDTSLPCAPLSKISRPTFRCPALL
jgi:hypothetical protein